MGSFGGKKEEKAAAAPAKKSFFPPAPAGKKVDLPEAPSLSNPFEILFGAKTPEVSDNVQLKVGQQGKPTWVSYQFTESSLFAKDQSIVGVNSRKGRKVNEGNNGVTKYRPNEPGFKGDGKY